MHYYPTFFSQLKHTLFFLAFLLPLTATQAHADIKLRMWYHAETEKELVAIRHQVERFNASQTEVEVLALPLPESAYRTSVDRQAQRETLPDIMYFNGAYLSKFVWQGYLKPLNQYLPKPLLDDLLPSVKAQGTYPVDGQLYAVSNVDSGVALWGNKRLLEKVGARIPESVADAWTLEEFENILTKLQRAGLKWPLDMKLNYGKGEWYVSAFAPIFQSFGADLISRHSWDAQIKLTGLFADDAVETLDRWLQNGWIVPGHKGDTRFYRRDRAALSLSSHRMYPVHKEALGEDLALIPMPVFGPWHVTSSGGWSWGITRDSKHPNAAAKFIEFVMSQKEILALSSINHGVPGTLSAVNASPLYQQGGDLHLYVEQLQSIANPRPFHPVYPVLSRAFAGAIEQIMLGDDAMTALMQASIEVDNNIAANNGYPPFDDL